MRRSCWSRATCGGAAMQQSTGSPHSIRLFNPERIDIGAEPLPRGHLRSSDAAFASSAREPPMSHLALVSPTFRAAPSPTTQWAHDIRNTLTTAGPHLDTLERLAGSAGHK